MPNFREIPIVTDVLCNYCMSDVIPMLLQRFETGAFTICAVSNRWSNIGITYNSNRGSM